MFVRLCFGLDGYYGSAEKAWAGRVRPHSGRTPPPGVPVYFRIQPFGHVTLSAGGGYVFSNDIARTGYISKVHISTIESRWNAPYLGWDEFVNRVRVLNYPLITARSVTAALESGNAHPHGVLLKRELAAAVGRGNMDLSSAKLGSAFRSQSKKYQDRVGGAIDGTLNSLQLGFLADRRHAFTARY
jgi:hypothetical protein